MWFQKLFGFVETPESVRSNLQWRSSDSIRSTVNGRSFDVGQFSVPSVKELRRALLFADDDSFRGFNDSHVVTGDVLPMHAQHPGALFQAASQFNCLESPHSTIGPESGLSRYELDFTQGPACALACAAGTVWRHYFVPLRKADGTIQTGQTAETQINCLADLETLLGRPYWQVKNGYLSSTVADMEAFKRVLETSDRDLLLQSIRIGLQRNVPVNFKDRQWTEVEDDVRVHQAYCSAVSCAYDRAVPLDTYAPLAQLVLDAAYEATLLSAKICGAKTVFLTALGGGVFGNRKEWIKSAMQRAITRVGQGLDIRICHFRELDRELSS